MAKPKKVHLICTKHPQLLKKFVRDDGTTFLVQFLNGHAMVADDDAQYVVAQSILIRQYEEPKPEPTKSGVKGKSGKQSEQAGPSEGVPLLE